MTRIYILTLLLLSFSGVLLAQGKNGLALKRSVALTPSFQQWKIDDAGTATTVSQLSTIVDVAWPLTKALKLNMTAGFAGSRGDLPQIQSVTDLHVNGSYVFPEIGTVVMLKVNIPTGKQTLSMAELPAAIFIGNPVLGFKVPSLGQGFNIAPGVLWAYTLHKDVTIGLGASWQYRGGYSPLDNAEIIDLSSFNPGNEFLLAGGLDYRLNDASAMSLDAVVTSYELDKSSALDLFKAGSRFVTTLQFQQFYNFNELRLIARYQGQGRNDVLALGYENETIPGFRQLAASFRARLAAAFWMTAVLDYKNYQEIPVAISGGSVIRFGLQPLIRITRTANISFFAAYNIGSMKDNLTLSGAEAGAALSLEF